MAWTITETVDKRANSKLLAGEEIFRVKLVCTADASGTDYDLVTTDIKGAYLYMVKTVPGAGGDAPTAVYQIELEDAEDTPLLLLTGLSTSATEINSAASTIGLFPPIFDKLSLVVNNQVGNANVITVYLYFTH